MKVIKLLGIKLQELYFKNHNKNTLEQQNIAGSTGTTTLILQRIGIKYSNLEDNGPKRKILNCLKKLKKKEKNGLNLELNLMELNIVSKIDLTQSFQNKRKQVQILKKKRKLSMLQNNISTI